MSDIEIINIFYTSKGKINPHLTNEQYLNNHIDIKNYLEHRYNDSLSIQETLYRIKNNIEARPICKVCGNPVKFICGIGFRETCSVSCAKNIIHNNIDITDYNIILKDVINNNILNNNKLQEKYLKDHGYYNFLASIYTDSTSTSEKIYRLYYNIEKKPICKECGKQLNYKNFIIGYGNFCNDICKEKYQYKNKNITDKDIINLLFNNDDPIYPRFEIEFLKAYHIYNYLLNRFSDSLSITETIYRIKNHIYNVPTCKVCGNTLKFIKYSIGFGDTCSINCKYKLLENNVDNNIINDQYIKEKFLNKDNRKNGCDIRDSSLKSKNVYNYLQNRFKDCSVKEAIYRIKNDINDMPACPICGKKLAFRNIHIGYQTYCSNSCMLKQKTIDKYKEIGYDIEIQDKNIIVKNACKKHPEFKLGIQTFYRRLNNNEELCPICNPHKTTSIEDKIINLLNKYNIKYYIHDRQHIYPLELDLYLPEYNIGIECNGIYWHSDYNIEKYQQRKKLNICKSKNIKLLTFWEDDIINNINKIESILLSICGLNEKIYARKCIVKEIDSKVSRDFINANHLQGNINASIKLGLFYNNKLIEVMTFGKTRKPLGGKQLDGDYELYRLCSLFGYTIVGGASKLLNYFKNHYNWNTIISYCQNDISDGNVYEKIGFTFSKDCGLSYCYYDKQGNKINRFSLRKSNVDDNSGRTADEIVKSLGYLKCWNSGNKKYIMINENK